uniref:ABC transporter B family member 14 n=1 Tax=Noccaea caerulescens TaxID=107243 RepID=A0A1J3KA87_NOCCA
MDEPNKVVSGTVSPSFSNTSLPVVEFIDASFAYPTKENVEVLKHVNLKIMHGESIAIVGPSGSGKSSIVSLILRFYDLTAGQIRIDGRDIKDINISSLREKIGFVSQEPTLFSGSLRENVEYGLR